MKINLKILATTAAILAISSSTLAYAGEKTSTDVMFAEYGIVEGSNPASTYSELVMGPTVPVRNKLTVYDGEVRRYEVDLDVEQFVFEGLSPLIADVNGDGIREVIVTETDKVQGASIAVYGILNGELAKLAQNPFLGKRPQWLSSVGIADFDNDGINEIAVVEKPHGGNVFAIWKLNGNQLEKLAELQGPTNHVEGTDHIQSALRTCNGQVDVLLSDHEWSDIYSLTLDGGVIVQKTLGKFSGIESIYEAAKSCE